MAQVQSGVAATSFSASPRTLTFSQPLTAGSTLIVCLYNASGLDTTAATCGGNAMTLDLEYDGGGTNYRHVYRYYSASGGETTAVFTFTGGTIAYFMYFEDNAINNADAVDNTKVWASSDTPFGTTHSWSLTAGVPAAGGLLVALINRDDITGASGTSALSNASSGAGMLYKAGIAAGANTLDCTTPGNADTDGMVISYNYASAGTDLNIAQSGGTAVTGALSVTGDIGFDAPWEFEAPLEITGVEGTLALTGDIDFPAAPPHDIAQSGAITLAGALTVEGNPGVPVTGEGTIIPVRRRRRPNR